MFFCVYSSFFFCDCCCCNFLKSLNLGPIISTLSGLIMSTLRPQKWTAHENAAKLMEDLFFCFPPFKPLGTLQEQSNQNCVSWGGYPNKARGFLFLLLKIPHLLKSHIVPFKARKEKCNFILKMSSAFKADNRNTQILSLTPQFLQWTLPPG